MEEMTLDEFEKKLKGKNSKWDWNKFEIYCKKCDSKKVEFNGFLESEIGYYEGEHSLEGAIIVKCHKCGNAFRIDAEYDFELNTGGEERIKEADTYETHTESFTRR